MHGSAMSGWLLMALCATTGAYCLLRTRSETGEGRRTARAEALMGFGMAAMAVPAAVVTPPAWGWAVYAALFGAASLRALWFARRGSHHLHHLVGSSAMFYMALTMAPGGGPASGGHGGHMGHGAAATAGGVPLLTGLLLAYYAVYVLRSGARLIPVAAAPVPAGGGLAGTTWGTRPELALACRLTMGMAMFAMLLTL
ncbi:MULTISPECIES: DUF5134 domain-containing protein [Streptomyces]|uniref:DUF5134 domain-containing protein n=1 Tax=Streptomyces TaxID=1883 RepID=UPI0022564049|nr:MULTISPECIES: DUF5134 domain-containing protein [unclassified Streptomyces]MCX4868837.1 DUF5134 domain-containing protein [Streptomyces sp. NBC_00906]MCX4900075.1 DUF5134 domain-containing protein [Streptomyces sp. NBC_00892]